MAKNRISHRSKIAAADILAETTIPKSRFYSSPSFKTNFYSSIFSWFPQNPAIIFLSPKKEKEKKEKGIDCAHTVTLHAFPF